MTEPPLTPDALLVAEPLVPASLAGRVRVRVGALVVDDPADPRALLLAEHRGLWPDADGVARPFWTPPGGGVEFGESLPEALAREVEEEAGLAVVPGAVRYVLDFVRPPLHAVSFYVEAHLAPGVRAASARLGADPELAAGAQILQALRWVPLDEVPHLVLYPEPLRERLAGDLRGGYPGGTVYLGTYR